MKTKVIACILTFLTLATDVPAKIALIGNANMSDACKHAIRTYGEDIELLQGRTVYVDVVNWDEMCDPESLRDYLRNLYYDQDDPLEGAIFIGELPIAEFEVASPKWPDAFPCDRFFMDLDGTWLDNAKDGDWDITYATTKRFTSHTGIYDTIAELMKDQDIEIWVSRVVASGVPVYEPDEEKFIVDYLMRARNRMAGGNEPQYSPRRFLGFADDETLPVPGSPDMGASLMGYGTNNDQLRASRGETHILKRHLIGPYAPEEGGYEFCYISGHGNATMTGSWALTSDKYRNLSQTNGHRSNCLFYYLQSCTSCRWTVPYLNPESSDKDCIGALLGQTDQGLVTIGSTKIIEGSPNVLPYTLFSALGSDSSFGAAFKLEFQPSPPSDAFREGVFDMREEGGMVILGAGNLQLNPRPPVKCLMKQANINKPPKDGSLDFQVLDNSTLYPEPHNSQFKVLGCGKNIAGYNDQFQYFYHNLNGDGTILVRLISMSKAGKNSKAGIMIRESLTPNSRHVSLMSSYNKALRLLRRTSNDGGTATTFKKRWGWNQMKLIREGDKIIAEAYKGGRWRTIGTVTVPGLANNCYIGIAVNSGNQTSTCKAVFNNVWYPAQTVGQAIYTGWGSTIPSYQVVLGGSKDFTSDNTPGTSGGMGIYSGIIDDGENSKMRIIAQAGEVDFNYRVSSEPNYDFFTARLDGKEIVHASGESSDFVQEFTMDNEYYPQGRVMSLELEYSKDGSVSEGTDGVSIGGLYILPAW